MCRPFRHSAMENVVIPLPRQSLDSAFRLYFCPNSASAAVRHSEFRLAKSAWFRIPHAKKGPFRHSGIPVNPPPLNTFCCSSQGRKTPVRRAGKESCAVHVIKAQFPPEQVYNLKKSEKYVLQWIHNTIQRITITVDNATRKYKNKNIKTYGMKHARQIQCN